MGHIVWRDNWLKQQSTYIIDNWDKWLKQQSTYITMWINVAVIRKQKDNGVTSKKFSLTWSELHVILMTQHTFQQNTKMILQTEDKYSLLDCIQSNAHTLIQLARWSSG